MHAVKALEPAGPDDNAHQDHSMSEHNSADSVLQNDHLLGAIINFLGQRDLLIVQLVNTAFYNVVRLSHCWGTIHGCVVQKSAKNEDATNKPSFQEGNVLGNNFTRVVRQFGQFAKQLSLRSCLWLYATGLEEIGR